MKQNAKQQKIQTLIQTVRQSHFKVRCALQHAKTCGDALLELKKLIPHGEWQTWLEENIPDIAYPTLAEYMRLAKNWNSQAVQKALQDDNPINTIRDILNASRKSHPIHTPSSPTSKQRNKSQLREELRNTFGQALLSLSTDELEMFAEIFNTVEQGWWCDVVKKLHHLVCAKYESDPYEPEPELDKSPTLTEKGVEDYLNHVKQNSPDSNFFIDRQKIWLLDELTRKISRLTTLLALNKKRFTPEKQKASEKELALYKNQFKAVKRFLEGVG